MEVSLFSEKNGGWLAIRSSEQNTPCLTPHSPETAPSWYDFSKNLVKSGEQNIFPGWEMVVGKRSCFDEKLGISSRAGTKMKNVFPDFKSK